MTTATLRCGLDVRGTLDEGDPTTNCPDVWEDVEVYDEVRRQWTCWEDYEPSDGEDAPTYEECAAALFEMHDERR